MEYNSLFDLILALQYGTKLHIGVVFLGNFGTEKTYLPRKHSIHTAPVCELHKSTKTGLRRCIRCRNLAIRRAALRKNPFGGLCINGVYEYTHPVVQDGQTVCVIYAGNILTESGRKKLENRLQKDF